MESLWWCGFCLSLRRTGLGMWKSTKDWLHFERGTQDNLQMDAQKHDPQHHGVGSGERCRTPVSLASFCSGPFTSSTFVQKTKWIKGISEHTAVPQMHPCFPWWLTVEALIKLGLHSSVHPRAIYSLSNFARSPKGEISWVFGERLWPVNYLQAPSSTD